jgi:hypothetical protein
VAPSRHLQSSLARQEFIHQVGGIRMRGLLFVAVGMLAVGAVNPASAADILGKAPPIQPPAPVYNWTGFYNRRQCWLRLVTP